MAFERQVAQTSPWSGTKTRQDHFTTSFFTRQHVCRIAGESRQARTQGTSQVHLACSRTARPAPVCRTRRCRATRPVQAAHRPSLDRSALHFVRVDPAMAGHPGEPLRCWAGSIWVGSMHRSPSLPAKPTARPRAGVSRADLAPPCAPRPSLQAQHLDSDHRGGIRGHLGMVIGR